MVGLRADGWRWGREQVAWSWGCGVHGEDVMLKWEPRAGGFCGGGGDDGSMQGEAMRWNWPVAAWDYCLKSLVAYAPGSFSVFGTGISSAQCATIVDTR